MHHQDKILLLIELHEYQTTYLLALKKNDKNNCIVKIVRLVAKTKTCKNGCIILLLNPETMQKIVKF